MTKISRHDFLQMTLAAAAAMGLPPALVGCGGSPLPCSENPLPKPPLYTSGETWTNALGQNPVKPKHVCYPQTIQDLIDIVTRAERENRGVRAVGSGHSYSDITHNEDYLVRTHYLNQIKEVDPTALRSGVRDSEGLLQVDAGVTICHLNEELDNRSLALVNMGGYDAQTLAGVVSTATHGSGLDFGPITSQILSLRMVGTGGRVFQIEPTRGITDRAKFQDFIDTPQGRRHVELIQSDEIFDAVVVSMGCMGLIHSFVLRPTNAFWLHEERDVVPWSELTRPGGFVEYLLRNRRPPQQNGRAPEYYEILLNPYASLSGPHGERYDRCVVTKRFREYSRPKMVGDCGARGQLFFQAMESILRKHGREAVKMLVSIANHNPGSVPGLIGGVMPWMKDTCYNDVSHKVFHAGNVNQQPAYAVELAFKLEDTIRATNRLFEMAKENLKSGKGVHSAPVSLRFVGKTSAHLAPQHDRDTCMMEIQALVGVNKTDPMLLDYEKTFMREFGARPHWGLDLKAIEGVDELKQLYPTSFEKWKKAYQYFNHRGTFDNALTDRLGLSRSRKTAP